VASDRLSDVLLKEYRYLASKSSSKQGKMQFCYIDEAGCTGTLATAISPVQPVLVISAVIIDQALIRNVTRDFLSLKRRFYPGALLPNGRQPIRTLDWVLAEVKGSDVRRAARLASRRSRRHAIGFLDQFIRLLDRHNIRIIGRLWVKGIGQPIAGRAIYTSSIQAICTYFQSFLVQGNELGLIIADSRTKPQNASVAHSIFTTKFKSSGDDHGRVIEMPTFGHSENHVGIQIADILCSALIFPMAVYGYCTGYVNNLHVHAHFQQIRDRFGGRLQALQYRFQDLTGRMRGGITVCDGLAQRPGSLLFH
jgi:hypothetical protein